MNKVISIDEFIQRVGMQSLGNIWCVLISDLKNVLELIEELNDTISIFAECEIKVISGEQEVDNLIEQIDNATEDYLILYQVENWQQKDWRKFDAYRSRLDKHKLGGLVLLSSEAAKKMLNNAPNFASWLGSRIYNIELNTELLSVEEKESRLSALREWSKQSDT